MNTKTQHLSVFAVAILLLTATIHAQAQFNYTTLSVPGATSTAAGGISGNNIVGYYSDASGIHGFLYNGSSYTTLNVPGAANTIANGISGNNIVGFYGDGNTDHGFLYNGSGYTTLNVPGATNTRAYGISGNNIVGDYDDGTTRHGFVYDGSSYTTLNAPGAIPSTYVRGISGNQIVGYYYGSAPGIPWNTWFGFLYNGASYSTLRPNTYAYGISGNNIVGPGAGGHGYLYNGSSYTTLDVPGANSTCPSGISGNNIVGWYVDASGHGFGFLATPAPPPLHLAGAQQWAGLISLQLTWTNSWCQCVLETAGELTGAWNTVSSPWTTNSGCVCTVVTSSSSAQFYRLRAN